MEEIFAKLIALLFAIFFLNAWALIPILIRECRLRKKTFNRTSNETPKSYKC